MKYIIKNCPATYINHNNEYDCDKSDYFCQDCTDCIMKRIVNECKMNMSNDNFKYVLEHKNDEGIIWLTDSSKAILNILRLLEIEEINEM